MIDPREAFKTAMLKHGITPPPNLISDSTLHRFYVDGDRKGSLNGAYTLHLDARPSGWAMHYKTGVSFTWTLSGKRDPMSDAMKKQIKYARQVRQQEQAKAHAKTANKTRWIWEQATPITEPSYPYHNDKRIRSHGERLYKEVLAIPIQDETGMLVNLQFINPDGQKRFLSGGRKKGCFSTIGGITETILMCEGWATGASLHESTGHYVIVAMDAGNLKPVAEVIRKQHPTATIIIAGDNDETGVGQQKANDAALACGGKMFIPPVLGMDWNDYINQGGTA